MENHGTQIGIRINSSIGFPSIVSRDPDTVDYIARVKLTGALFGTTLAQERLTEKAVDEKFKMLKGTLNPFGISNFLAMKGANTFAGITTLDGVRVPWRSDMPTPTNNGFVSGDLSRAGLTGGAGKYINANRNGNLEPRNNYHQSSYASPPSDISARFVLGSDSPASGSVSQIYVQGNGVIYRNRQFSGNNGGPMVAPRFLGHSRIDVDYFEGFNGTGVEVYNASSIGDGGFTTTVVGRSASNPYDGTVAYYAVGESVDLEAVREAIETYMAAIL